MKAERQPCVINKIFDLPQRTEQSHCQAAFAASIPTDVLGFGRPDQHLSSAVDADTCLSSDFHENRPV